MKNLFVLCLGLGLALTAHAADTTSPDPFMALDDNLPAPTPVFSKNGTSTAAPAPAPVPPAAMDNPPPALDATASPTDTAGSGEAPIPLSSIPGKTEDSPAPAAVNADSGKDIYDEYNDYLDRTHERERSEKDYSRRNLFPHEDGAWQVGITYARNAFSGYNFNRSGVGTRKNPDTNGAVLSLTYFPIRSLAFGRLGLGPVVGVYWSTFTTPTNGSFEVVASPQQVFSYGGRAIYEFDYWLGQILVPFAFIGIDQVQIKQYTVVGANAAVAYDTGPSRNVSATNYGGGLRFNLNRVEPTVASRALVNVGIKKFYLTYTALDRSGELAGLTHNLGLDFEF